MIQFRDLEQEYGEQLDAMPLAEVEALVPSDFVKRFLRRIALTGNGPKYAIHRAELLLALARRSRDEQKSLEF